MGFFSDIIIDAQRASTAAFRTSAEPGGENIQEHSLDDPGHVVTETLPQQRAGAVRAAPQPVSAHEVWNLDAAAPPPAMPETGSGTQDAGIPEHGVLAEPDASASMVPLATENERIGAHLGPRHREAHIDLEHEGYLRPALAKSPAAVQPSPVHGAEDGADFAVKARDGRLEQKLRKVAMLRQAEDADLQLVAPQRPVAGFETVTGIPASQPETEAISPADVADGATPARQEAAILGSVASRPAASAPAAIDLAPARRPGQSQGAAMNAGPQVHIGHIDIVVLAPEPARPIQPSVSASADLVSRHYLRRL
ncbi:MAG: hypothetical protein Q8K43_03700 [Sulfurimicrobium sp.]|jgi:hypothetical protein|nr:hypothetical protein [Sulfurimicrobium sp.]MDP2964373.1 hypothetical protein [Sulfurimicrobium sp.]MDZ7657002.1 hypothetical protein [Sulfurimicrobium sp.]